MNKDEIFSTWTPDESPWSRWVKPVLFAHIESVLSYVTVTETAGDVTWAPPPGENVMLVLDLPGPEGILTGLALATRGYRPIPLYNAVPLPFTQTLFDPSAGGAIAAVDVVSIISALRLGSEQLAQLKLPAEAPPVFLLDANRGGDGQKLESVTFDNRSISFTTDFPSANFLASRGIRRVILVQKGRVEPQPDLVHSICRWQEAGFILERKRIELPDPPERFEAARPPWYSMFFQRALASLGLHRAAGGGFGSWMPDSSAGG